MLLGTLGSSLIGNLLTGKGLFRAGTGNKFNCGQGLYRAGQNQGKGLSRAGQGTKKKSLMPGNFSLKNSSHPLTNFEIEDYYKNGSRFNSVYCNMHMSYAYVINLDEYKNTGTH